MSGLEVAAAAGRLLPLADTVIHLGENYYKASAAWSKFPTEVALLHARHEHLEEQFKRYGKPELPHVLKALEEAKRLISEEVDTLHNRTTTKATSGLGCLGCTLPCGWLGEVVFPVKVGLAVRTATEAYDSIIQHLDQRQAAQVAIRNEVTAGRVPLQFRKDISKFYVPFELTESNIYSALNKATANPSVVLVHGGPGKGKSTVVRQISATLAEGKSSFDHVFFLECGPEADVETKQVELLQALGGNNMSMAESQSNECDSKITRQSLLQAQLKAKKFLIVLDDVSEPQFLQKFLDLGGEKVKYIITSQQKDLCDSLPGECILVQIEDLEPDNAGRILAVHARIPNQLIPEKFKDVAEKILAQAEGIPLVVAQLGAQIGKADNEDLEVWESLADDILKCLGKPTSNILFGTSYTKSWWAAMIQSSDRLNQEAKQLLCLLGMCKGPSTPESVVQFLYSNVFSAQGCTKYEFSQMKKDLESRQLIFEKDKNWLSLHSLTKTFIQGEMKDIVESIAHHLPGVSSHVHQASQMIETETRVTTALACLYLDPAYAQTLLQPDQSLSTFSELKRRTVEPIVQKLVPNIMFGKTYAPTESRTAAIQVFLEFICKDTLSHDQISELLGCGTWMMPTLKFLEQLYFMGPSFWDSNTLHDISSMVLHIYQEHDESDLLKQARQTLLNICACHDRNSCDVAANPKVFHQLLESLSQVKNLHLQSDARGALARLLYNNPFIDIGKIENFPKILESLVQPMAANQDFTLQLNTTWLLLNITATKDSSTLDKIVDYPNLLCTLGELLAKANNPLLQQHAAAAIANLGAGDQVHKSKIVGLPHLLERLLQCATQDEHFDLRSQAACALGRLASVYDIAILDNFLHSLGELPVIDHGLQEQAALILFHFGIGSDDLALTRKILDFPHVLQSLVYYAAQDQNINLQLAAAKALQNLAATNDNSTRDQMANYPDLLCRLGELLAKANNPLLQQHAAAAIANLGIGDNKVLKGKIVSVPHLLDRLLQCATQDEHSDLRRDAARALGTFASAYDNAILDNFLQSLGEMPMTDHGLQEQAALILFHFGIGSDNNALKRKILDFPHVLQSLVHYVTQNQNFILQVAAAKALWQLSATDDNRILDQMENYPNLVHKLGELLVKGNSPFLQEYAAAAIGHLGWRSNKAHKSNIISFPDILERLVQIECGAQDKSLGLQNSALYALAVLSYAWDTSIVNKLVNFSNLVGSLVKRLMEENRPIVQVNAACIIGNLGLGRDSAYKNKTVLFTGLLDQFVHSTGQNQDASLRKQAAGAVANEASTWGTNTLENAFLRTQRACLLNNMASTWGTCILDDLLDWVAKSLKSEHDHVIQRHAVAVLVLLGITKNRAIKSKMVIFPELLERLIYFVAQDNNLALQFMATHAVRHLAATRDSSILDKIAIFPKLLTRLQELLINDRNPLVQDEAAWALANLTGTKCNASWHGLVNWSLLLDRVINSMCNSESRRFDQDEARALGNLADIEDAMVKDRLASSSEVLGWLGEALEQGENLCLQERAAWALANLASTGDRAIKDKIANFSPLLEKLIRALDEDGNPRLQVQAARALSNLPHAEDTTIDRRLASLLSDTRDNDVIS